MFEMIMIIKVKCYMSKDEVCVAVSPGRQVFFEVLSNFYFDFYFVNIQQKTNPVLPFLDKPCY